MSTKLKLYIGRKVIDSVKRPTKFTPTELLPSIQIGNVTKNNNLRMYIPLQILEKNFGMTDIADIMKIQPDDIIKNIEYGHNKANRKLNFEIDRNIFIKDVIENCSLPDINLKPKTIVFEYSSPNVAKPFHLGHLRSTMIGNFLSNLNSFLHNKVIKINYLGDWGTQFGFIKVGVDKLKHTSDDIKSNPLKILYDSYVYANKLAETDPTILELAKQEFSKLEKGSSKDRAYWEEYMNYTRDELKNIYDRLGVEFDEYHYESMYGAKQTQQVIDLLRKKNIIHKEKDGKETTTIDDRKVTVVKSDGSTLYLTRDVAAAVDRYKKYKFDKMYYVVDNAQSDHFNTLKGILFRMDYPWADRLRHIKFGRIHGLSSRKGNAVFLRDILDECREIMIKRQIQSPTTKAPIDDVTSDILGVTCVIVNDLKQRRQKDYEFSWDKVLQVQGDTGIKLQYTHCRLHSLEKNSGAIRPQECLPQFLNEPEVTDLIQILARFQDTLYKADTQFESCLLVAYLFFLCNQINRSLKVLRVKDSEPELASQRLLLFLSAKNVLSAGMTILGLRPLNEM